MDHAALEPTDHPSDHPTAAEWRAFAARLLHAAGLGGLNVGLALLCGGLGLDHFLWRVIDGWGWNRAALLMLPALATLLGAGLFLLLRGTRFAEAAPLWLPRLLLTAGLAYGTAAS